MILAHLPNPAKYIRRLIHPTNYLCHDGMPFVGLQIALGNIMTLAGALAVAASLLVAPALAQSLSSSVGTSDEPITLVADELEYDREDQLIIARGNVEVLQGDQIVMADEIIIFQIERRVRANGNVVIVSSDGQVVFGETAELTDDFKDGFIRKMSVLLEDDTRIAAVSGRRIGGTELELNRIVASPCRECASESGQPLWQIRAQRVTHNSATGNIIYRHARIEIFGVPVFYTPYLSHPDPTVKRRTGLLAPQVGTDSDLGGTLRVPYFVELGSNKDIFFDPLFTTEGSVLLSGEYRQRFNNGEIRSRMGVAREDVDSGGINYRGFTDTEVNFDVNDYWRAGADIQISSDDTFLDRYAINRADTLTSRVFAEGFGRRSYALAEAIGFQGLNIEDDQDLIPIVAPNIQLSYLGEPNYMNGRFSADLNIRGLTRRTGPDSQRVSVSGGWQMPIDGLVGDKITLNASARADLYYLHNSMLMASGRTFNGYKSRFYPEFSVDWRWPLVRPVGNHIQQLIEPVAKLVIAPNGGNPDGIPNEDSILFDFDETSLFKSNRLVGLDRVEGGKHFSYGTNIGVMGLGGGHATAFIGQSIQFTERGKALAGTGIENTFSDYVIRVEVAPIRFLNILYKTRLDKDTLETRRAELEASAGTEIFNFEVNYAFFDAINEFPTREQVGFAATSQVTPHWVAGAHFSRDLVAQDTLAYGATLTYQCDCINVQLSYTRSFTRDRDVDRTDTFLLKVTLKHLGELGN